MDESARGPERGIAPALLLVGLATAAALLWPAAAPLQGWIDGAPWRPATPLLVAAGLSLAALPFLLGRAGTGHSAAAPLAAAMALASLAAARLVPLDALLLGTVGLAGAFLARSRARIAALVPGLDALPDPILVVAAEGTIRAANAPARRLLGAPLVGRPIGRYLPALAESEARARLALRGAAVELEAVHESSRPLPVEVRIAANGDGWVVRLQEVGERHRERERMERLAWHDPLTGLPNRRLLEDRTGQALVHAERHRQGLALMLLDLDRFKEVNDTLGHQVGDLLLQQVAERLGGPLRRTDTLARLGGDEFAVLLAPPTGLETACRVAERLVEALVAPFWVDGSRLEVGVSIGVALFPDHGHDLATLLEQADAAMYKAKRERLGFAVCNAEQPDSTRRRLQMRHDLRTALERGELALLFQPKVAADARAVLGVEALLRWPHPELGLLEPAEFLPVVEQTGLGAPLAVWTLNACLEEQRRWRQAGFDLPVAVNLAPACLKLAELPQLVRLALSRWDTPADRLLLEVTETAVLADLDAALPMLETLAGIGCELSLDEFGAGRSSLVHLPRLAIHEVKIPRELVGAMETEPASRVVVRSLIRLAHGLGRRAVATGVERESDAARLATMRCDQLQGFLFGRPMGGEALIAMLRERAPPSIGPPRR
ncbi:MAG: EAL domain-containing protein [Geminicoccaceae bacterium]|nr:EAL domain-containing protein [Geminicoccaceae bacterium]MDW8371337.1 EAL domain-containing protein [Geminicoccaceae bacterium]